MDRAETTMFRVPEALAPYLRIGTCSWKYGSWKGLIYDQSKHYRPDDYLTDYAKHLKSVEVDQWFWSLFPGSIRLPEPEVVKLYARSVPDDFIFTVKAPNSLTLTHYYSRQAAGHADFAGKPNNLFLSPELFNRFLERLAPLGKKLGPIMFQFEYLNKSKMPSLDAFLERFLGFISRAPGEYKYALETRNPNYLSPRLFRALAEAGLGFVYLEGYYMPSIARVFEQSEPFPGDFSVIRLHGGDRTEIEAETGLAWDRVVSPKPEGLRAAARIVRANTRRRALTFVNINNHFEGSAPLTIERFLDALQEET